MPLIKNGRVSDDPFVSISMDDAVPDGDILVPAERYLAAPELFRAHQGRVGLLWPNNRNVDDLAPHLAHLALIALVFPKFRDGRAYSQARVLRERYRFGGELRATGDILRDQFVFFLRSGFDALDVRKQSDADAYADVVRRYSVVYQPAADGKAGALRERVLLRHGAGRNLVGEAAS